MVPDPVVNAMTAPIRYVATYRLSLPLTIFFTGLATVSIIRVFFSTAPMVNANITRSAILSMLTRPPLLQMESTRLLPLSMLNPLASGRSTSASPVFCTASEMITADSVLSRTGMVAGSFSRRVVTSTTSGTIVTGDRLKFLSSDSRMPFMDEKSASFPAYARPIMKNSTREIRREGTAVRSIRRT